MKPTFFLAITALLRVSGVHAFPIGVEKRASSNSTATLTQVLQYVLTGEHLESTFYSQALTQFDADAFTNAGFPDWVRGRFVQIGQHEATHVSLLESVLGSDAVAPCNYSLCVSFFDHANVLQVVYIAVHSPYTDPKSFASLAMTLEGVVTAGLLGVAADLASSIPVIEIAGAILPTEARHDSWIASSVLGQQPWNGAFETPLGANQAFTIASSFITSCPASNPALPFTSFPALEFEGTPAPGQTSTLNFIATSGGSELFVAFLSGLNSTFAPLNSGQTVAVPEGLQGTVYAVVTNNGSSAADANTVAGPAILQFPLDPFASNA